MSSTRMANTSPMAPDGRRTDYPLGQEIAHAVTHGAGALLGVVALVLLVWRGVQAHDPWRIVAGAVYGTSLILLFSASSLYHALRPGRAKQVFQALDHAAIYFLIAGTYTPFALVTLRGPWGWSLLGIVWALAAGGIVFEVLVRRRYLRRLSLVLYLALGWLALIVAVPLVRHLPAPGPLLLLIGGIFYSGGAGFYAARGLAWNHAIWHLFVLAAAAFHFFCVYICVMG